MIQPDGSTGPETEREIQVDDRTAPHVLGAEVVLREPILRVSFSEPVEKATARDPRNYLIEPGITVRKAVLEDRGQRVALTLNAPLKPGLEFVLRVRNVRDDSPAHNVIAETKLNVAAPAPVFSLFAPTEEQRGKSIRVDSPLPVKAGDHWTLNIFVRTDKQPPNRTIIAGFGSCGGNPPQGDATGRYICKFGHGIHFWSHHSDLEGNVPLDLNRWQMLTATYDGKTLRLYKDGKLLSEQKATLADDQPVVNIAPIDPWDRKRQFEGEVRDLTIWSVALDESAIQSIQFREQAPLESR
jgi:alpha-mannosidase